MIVIPSSSKHFKYFTGFDAGGCVLVKKRLADKGIIYCTGFEFEKVKSMWPCTKKSRFEQTIKKNKYNKSYKTNKPGKLSESNKSSKLSKSSESNKSSKLSRQITVRVPFDVPHLFFKKLRGIKIMDCEEELWNLRMIKTGSEKKKIMEAEKICKELAPGIEKQIKKRNEKDCAKWLVKQIIDASGMISFYPVVAYDKNTRFPHHTPTSKRCSKLALIDFGAKNKGYCSDVTVMFGYSREHKNRIEMMHDSWQKLKRMIKPGAGSLKIAAKCNNILSRYFPKHNQMIHSLAHSIGMDVHECPVINLKTNFTLKKGMVFALEPAIYTKSFGLRIENEVYV